MSAASAWELAIKVSQGRIKFSISFADLIGPVLEGAGIAMLQFESNDLVRIAALGYPTSGHRDPFDRMLVAQAIERNLVLVSRDKSLDAYGVKRLWVT